MTLVMFFVSVGIGMILGVRLCGVFSRQVARINQRAADALADERPIQEVLDEIERLNIPERGIKIYPQWQVFGPGEFRP